MLLAVALFFAVAVEIYAAFFLSIKSGGRCRRDRLVDNNNDNNKFTIRSRSQMIFRAVLSGSVLSCSVFPLPSFPVTSFPFPSFVVAVDVSAEIFLSITITIKDNVHDSKNKSNNIS